MYVCYRQKIFIKKLEENHDENLFILQIHLPKTFSFIKTAEVNYHRGVAFHLLLLTR